MTFIHYKNIPQGISFNKTLQTNLRPSASHIMSTRQNVPVNILEEENGYIIEVFAPGFKKEDFKISVDKNVLKIEAEQEERQNSVNYLQKEYTVKPFSRSFTITENIDQERISANFVNGVLTLNLGRKDAVLNMKKEITIL